MFHLLHKYSFGTTELNHSTKKRQHSFYVLKAFYFRYVDDSFVIFGSELDCDHFQEKLNLLHPALKFTVEKESFTIPDN